MSELWDEHFVGDEECTFCGKPLLDCQCIDDEELPEDTDESEREEDRDWEPLTHNGW